MFSLPTDILVHEIYPFLDCAAVGRIDVAVSQYELRILLFEVYPFCTFDFISGGFRFHHIKWYFDRSIAFRNFFISDDVPSREISRMFDMISRGIHGDRVEAIYLTSCRDSVTKFNYKQILQTCSMLRSLCLSGCKYVSKSFLLQLDKSCPLLSLLDISECRLSISALEAVSCGFLQMRKLLLRECGRLTKSAVVSLATCHPLLVALSVSGSSVADEDVSTVAEGCGRLESLTLNNCSALTDESLKALSLHCSKLTSINLGGCTSVTAAGIVHLACGCPLLRVVDLTCCAALTDEAVITLALNCPFLTKVALRECDLLTDVAVMALARNGTCLTALDVCDCEQLTDIAISALSQGCPNLASLNLAGCNNLTCTALLLLFKNEETNFSSLQHVVLSERLMFEIAMASFVMGLSQY